jgi:hypothetical protein
VPLELYNEIRALSDKYEQQLKRQMDARVVEMDADNVSHYLVYKVLGIPFAEGQAIDVYQNKGRFLYKYAGSFLENATKLCFVHRHPDAAAVRIANTQGLRPKTFEIDCLTPENDAIEIKWRDATTDGDHITKEHTRLQVIAAAGYKPIRVMFYYPNREQAKRIQRTLETLYAGAKGEYHHGVEAWDYVKRSTGADLLAIMEQIAREKTGEA